MKQIVSENFIDFFIESNRIESNFSSGIAFKNGLRERISSEIKNRTDFDKTQSKELKYWQALLHKHEAMEKVDKNTFEQAQTIYSGLKIAHEQNQQNVQALIELKKSLPKIEEGLLRQSVEALEQVIKKCDQRIKELNKQADELDEKMMKISNKIDSLPTKSSKRKKLEKEIDEKRQELETIEDNIEEENQTKKNTIENFEKKEPKLIEESIAREQARLADITKVLQETISILKIETPVKKQTERRESKFQRQPSNLRGASFRRGNSSPKTTSPTPEQ